MHSWVVLHHRSGGMEDSGQSDSGEGCVPCGDNLVVFCMQTQPRVAHIKHLYIYTQPLATHISNTQPPLVADISNTHIHYYCFTYQGSQMSVQFTPRDGIVRTPVMSVQLTPRDGIVRTPVMSVEFTPRDGIVGTHVMSVQFTPRDGIVGTHVMSDLHCWPQRGRRVTLSRPHGTLMDVASQKQEMVTVKGHG